MKDEYIVFIDCLKRGSFTRCFSVDVELMQASIGAWRCRKNLSWAGFCETFIMKNPRYSKGSYTPSRMRNIMVGVFKRAAQY